MTERQITNRLGDYKTRIKIHLETGIKLSILWWRSMEQEILEPEKSLLEKYFTQS
jgi:hypothetical protein